MEHREDAGCETTRGTQICKFYFSIYGCLNDGFIGVKNTVFLLSSFVFATTADIYLTFFLDD
jgi:hypothetical protein